MENLEQQLSSLKADLKVYFDKAAEEQKSRGAMLEETKTKIDAMQKQVDAIDQKLVERTVSQPGDAAPGLEETLKQCEDVQRILKNKKGHCNFTLTGKALREFEAKTTVTSAAVGAMTSGVLQIDRIPGIVPEARQELYVRDMLTARPTTMQVVDFVRVLAGMSVASPQTEGSDKGENAVTFESKSETVRTIATWVPASKQVLDDMTELLAFLQGSLRYYVDKEEEIQMLSGSGTGQNLAGLITQASAFNTTLLATTNWNKIDIVGRAVQQVMRSSELKPTFLVLNPDDWWDMRLTKDSFGRYILGDPATSGMMASGQFISPQVRSMLWDLQPVATTNVAAGTFLVGTGNSVGAEIRDRMELQVEISTEHSDYFTKNLVAIRGEKRLALIVKRPHAYITGTFTTSP